MTDKIKVQALKTFDMFDGHGLRTPEDKPFTVPSATVAELEANGLVVRVEDEKPKARKKPDENE